MIIGEIYLRNYNLLVSVKNVYLIDTIGIQSKDNQKYNLNLFYTIIYPTHKSIHLTLEFNIWIYL